ncbi:hypothetical protein [Jiangella endophytica]|uniref:hypothetical protein n=1 Tax=Jiangella endophytica TaxID=1623398 RepID=UPI0013004562|nr:hypothetical protein [Jiangella endophytica]
MTMTVRELNRATLARQLLPERAATGVADEAAGLSTPLSDRDPTVYRRYDRWWAGLPAEEVRVLPR